MTMTYREMTVLMINLFSDEQWDSYVTIEDFTTKECYPADLRIATGRHVSLSEGYPILVGGIEDEDFNSVDESHSLRNFL